MSDKYLLMNACAKTTKQGNGYFDVTLCNSEGTINGKYWSDYPDLKEFTGHVLEINGTIGEFNEEPQLTINSFEVTEDDPSEFCKRTKYNVDQMMNSIWTLVNSCQNPELKSILTDIFNEYEEEFKKHSGAKKVHHAFVGGLLQHTLCVASSASRLCTVYSMANRDIVLAAALLHDIGKLKELSNFPTVEYTRLGSCVGHVTLSVLEVSKYLDRISDELVRDKFLNCIMGHHGRLEWGSPVVPASIEAYIVHVSDLLDAKVECIVEASEKLKPGEVSGYISSLGGAVIGV